MQIDLNVNAVEAVENGNQETQEVNAVNIRHTMDSQVAFVVLTQEMPGSIKKIKNSDVNIHNRMVSANKRLFESEFYGKIKSFDNLTRDGIKAYTLPSGLKDGIYVVPMGAIDRLNAWLANRQVKRKELVDQFCDEYDSIIHKANFDLGALFNPRDYVTNSEIRSRFSFSYNFVSFVTPEMATKEIMEQEKSKAKEMWDKMLKDANDLLLSEIVELSNQIAFKLSDEKDGRKKKINPEYLAKYKDFADMLEQRNISGDEVIANCAKRMKEQLAEMEDNLGTIKEGRLREKLHENFEKISVMAVSAQKRKLVLD